MRLPLCELLAVLVTSTTLSLATPVPAKDGASVLGGLLDDVSNLINDTATALQAFSKVIRDLDNGTTENGLVGLLGMNITSVGDDDDDDDDGKNANATVSAAASNVTCPDMAVLFARGTGEPGNVGLYTGPSLAQALRVYTNTTSLAVQGVPYPATIPGFLAGGSAVGASAMAALANATLAACPRARLVIAGYSQGAQVVHLAVPLMSNTTAASIASVVVFGDPRNGTAIARVDAARVLSVCHDQDDICTKGGDVVTMDHLTYSRDAPAAAMFVMQKSALGLMSNDAKDEGMGNVPMVAMAQGQDGGQRVAGLGSA